MGRDSPSKSVVVPLYMPDPGSGSTHLQQEFPIGMWVMLGGKYTLLIWRLLL